MLVETPDSRGEDTEKWLLQISFQLMAENALYICNREQTEEQIESHNEQVDEIVEYQQTLEEVKNKGRKQIDRYIGTVPAIQDKIEHQLHNIQESYDSLLSTATHIQKRLNESLAKFEEYEATLESIEKNLEEWEPIIAEENDTTIQTMEEAKYHLECTRVKSLFTRFQPHIFASLSLCLGKAELRTFHFPAAIKPIKIFFLKKCYEIFFSIHI
ncbi:Nesprin-1 [Portunus trituberculatus]|uniref:Nesprin-1 n=1 Tax=Portunus trituberculatus TaxID=210409 RepID=A0A5B7JV09_PORTR|nr:Nesprin-1 [Portunus trituberculatus]